MVVCDRYLASSVAYGEAQGLGAEWLLGIQAGLPRPDVTVLLDIPPEVSATRKSEDRDKFERDLHCWPRAGQLPPRKPRRAAGRNSTPAVIAARSRPPCSRRSLLFSSPAVIARRGHRAVVHARGVTRSHLPRAARQQDFGARLERGAGRPHVVHEDTIRPTNRARPLRDRNGERLKAVRTLRRRAPAVRPLCCRVARWRHTACTTGGPSPTPDQRPG